MWDKQNTDLSTCISYFLEHDGVNNFGLSSENLMGLLTQEDIARAWLNPEETIEIVPETKWFVRSLVADEGYYSYLFKHSNRPIADYEPSKQPRKEYMTFDTKEEAEKWVNPLTEAVQLPVEGQ